ncbi:hypothetical protein [Stappia sp.]|uniref:hypothetical protein n=1 Tax=Stappia sp. TaxID=1870903 RepID=UPI003C7AB106
MPREIGSHEIGVLSQHVQSGDSSGYYGALESWGYRYGALAGGVGSNSFPSGYIANSYLEGTAAERGVIIDQSKAREIAIQLMAADFNARKRGVEKFGSIGELGYGPIAKYHGDVFRGHGLDRNSWTATTPLDVYARNHDFFGYDTPEAAKQAGWEKMLSGDSVGVALDMAQAAGIARRPILGSVLFQKKPPYDMAALAWLARVQKYGALNLPSVMDGSVFDKCFSGNTRILVPSGQACFITDLLPGDIVLSFDPAAFNGRGGLVPKRVTRIFTNITEEWLRLTWVENGEEKELVTTPGHHLLDRFGNFPQIERMIANGVGTVILADGSEATVTAERIVCSAATDDRFAQAIGWVTPSNRGRVLKSRRLRQSRRCSVRFKRQKHVSSPALEERLRRCADQSVRVIARSVSAGVLHSGLQEQSSRSVCAALKKRSGQICRCALL